MHLQIDANILGSGKKTEETIRLHMEIHGDLLIMRFPEWILIIYIYNISNVFSITSQNRYFLIILNYHIYIEK